LIGVIVLFVFLGWIVGKAEIKSKVNIYWTIVYYFLVSNSVFLVRSGFFDNLRPMIWAIILIYLYKLRLTIKNKKLYSA